MDDFEFDENDPELLEIQRDILEALILSLQEEELATEETGKMIDYYGGLLEELGGKKPDKGRPQAPQGYNPYN